MGSPRNTLNYARIADNKKFNDYKKRKGGISNKAWKGLSKKEKKEMKEAGLMMPRWREGMFGESGREKFSANQSIWESAAHSMGFGNVTEADQLRELYKKFEDSDIKKMDSMQDATAFDKTSKKNIDKAIEDGIAARWDEFMATNPGGGGEDAGGGDGTDPEIVEGAQDWNSRYMEVIEKFLDRMGGNNQQVGYSSPYSQGGHNMGWQPRGGW